MQFNRKLQYDVLKALAEVFPDSLLVASLPGYEIGRNFMGNLFYLKEHGLIEGGDIREPGQCRSMVDAQITKTGLDFIADDGGLPAILGHYQIKLKKDELIFIIDSSLKQSGLAEGRREEIVESLSSFTPVILKKLIEQYLSVSIVSNYEQLSSQFVDK